MKLLLTGATGFIGKYFIATNESHKITPFSFQYGEIISTDFSHYDTVVHLGALVHQMSSVTPAEYEYINVKKTIELANKAKEDKVKHFIFMSTVKVYGEESDTVYNESTPCYPQDFYGMSKWHAEQELQKLSCEHFTVSIIRTPIVYGTGVKANIKNLIELVKMVSVLPFGDTRNIRSMVYVGNLSALIESVLTQRRGGVFLACDDTPLSTTQFIQKIADAMGKKRYLLNIPLFENFLKYFKPSFYKRLFGNLIIDNSLTKKQLNFSNPYTTDQGIWMMLHEKCK
jgi:UDP-glucose 4-epimerase